MSEQTPKFAKQTVVRGDTPTIPFQFKWEDDDSLRNVSAETVKFRVYSDQGATPLFAEKTGVPDGSDTSVQNVTLSSSDTATPGSYYAELELRTNSGATIKKWLGTFVIAGP